MFTANQVIFFLTFVIWACLFDPLPLYLWLSIISAYMLIAVFVGKKKYNGVRATLRMGTWDPPTTSEIYCKEEIVLDHIDNFLEKHNKSSKTKLTYFHIVLKAIGDAMVANPSACGKIIFGK